MREIKFRIWNGHGQCMHEWPELVEKNKIHLLNAKNPTYTVMQLTGLKDSNDVDIYEGDIVDGFFRGFIEWSGEDCMYWVKNINGVSGGMGIPEYLENFKVIGNIHQNPELLKP